LLEQYLYYWKWFLLGALIALGIAYTYLRYAEKQYAVSAQHLLIERGAEAPELQLLSGMGIQSGNAAVTGQIRLLKSRRILKKVVENNQLNIRYFTQGTNKNVEVHSVQAPVQIIFANDSITQQPQFSGTLKIKHNDASSYIVSESNIITPGTYVYGANVVSAVGTFRMNNNNKKEFNEVEIVLHPSIALANQLMNTIDISPGKENNSKFVNISLVGPVKERSEQIINSLIDVYNKEMIKDNSKIANATSDFISQRLQIISDDLKGVDKELAGYKSQNNINLSVEEAGMFLSEASTADKEVIHINTQLQVAQHLVTTLKNQQNILLPSSVGIEDSALNTAINNYNQLVLEKQEYTKTMGADNPALQTINKNLADLKENIQNSLALYQNNLRIALKAAEQTKNRFEARLDRVPAQELGFRNIVRQQQIVESVYLNLLQKREEAE